jgi:protein arginine kinase
MEPWLQNTNPIWLGTQVALSRNVEQLHFPKHLQLEQQKQVYTLLSNLLTHQKEFEGGVLKRGDECQPIDREYLIEHFFLPVNQIESGPGNGFLLNSLGSLLGCFNLDNHLTLYGIEKEGHFEKLSHSLIHLQETLQKNIGFAFSNRFGYLTSQPELTGCGLKVRALLQLSALIHTKELDAVLESEKKEGIEALPFFKERSEWTLDTVAVENRYCLGITDEGILASIRLFVEKLIDKEQKKRAEIQSKPSEELKDKVSRSFAVLKHSYQIDAKEAMNALSLIKLGVLLGWVHGVEISALNELLFRIRRAHFLKGSQENISPDALLHRRADYLQQKLQPLSCSF